MSAAFSVNGEHRYQLTRDVQHASPIPQKIIGFCGVNPSKAGADNNDQTVTKLIEFTRRMNGTKLVLFNAFSHISTDVRELQHAVYPNDLNSNDWVRSSIAYCDVIVPMWGSTRKVPDRLRSRFDDVMQMIVSSNAETRVFGWCKPYKKHGITRYDPKHPLMLSYKTEMIIAVASMGVRNESL